MSASATPQTRPDRWAALGGPRFDLGRLLLGLVVLTLGVLFLLDSAGALNADRAIDHWWPLLIVAVGVFQLIEGRQSLAGPVILAGIGAVLLLFTTDALEEGAEDYVWPLILVGVGLLILSRWRGRPVPAGARDEDVVRASGIFGGPKVASTSRRFRGASLTAILGGVTLDLRQAQPVPEGAAINATAVLGGIEVLVPRGWRVTVSGTPILGGVEDKVERSQELPDDAPSLHVDAFTLLGGVEVKHAKE